MNKNREDAAPCSSSSSSSTDEHAHMDATPVYACDDGSGVITWMTGAQLLDDLPPALRFGSEAAALSVRELSAAYGGTMLRVRRVPAGFGTAFCGYLDAAAADIPAAFDWGAFEAAVVPHGRAFTAAPLGFDCQHMGDLAATYGDEPILAKLPPTTLAAWQTAACAPPREYTHKTWRFVVSEARRIADALALATRGASQQH